MEPSNLASRREEAIQALCLARAEGRIPDAVFQDRLELVREASTAGALDALVADLLPTGSHDLVVTDEHAVVVVPAERLRVACYFAQSSRAGQWTVPQSLSLRILFGEMLIDLREAAILSDVLDVDLDCFAGTLRLIVPPGTQIENESEEFLATSTHKRMKVDPAVESFPPPALLVRITGKVVLGELTIRERPPAARERPWWKRLLPGR